MAALVRGAAAEPALVVDLDGTLLATDLLWESVIALARQDPGALLRLPLWAARGRPRLKAEIARRVALDVARLPYREELLAFLREERARGRRIVLATASHRSLAEAVAGHVSLFAEVVATDGAPNLSGLDKRRALEARLGSGAFDYAGDAAADLPVWQAARRALVVTRSRRLERKVSATVPVARLFRPPAGRLRALARAARLQQWVKNALVFAPLILAHQVLDPLAVARTGAAFLAFSLCASGVYLLNDLLDLEADRAHPVKRTRPFAAGTLPVTAGLAAIPPLLAAGLAVALALPPAFLAALGAYLILTTAYSLRLRAVVVADVVLLAVLYTLRVVAGGLAAGVPISPWLTALSIFLFQSLALLKRFAELNVLAARGGETGTGRGYVAGDRELLSSAGPASGYVAVLVLALYINSQDVVRLYQHPKILWAVCPLLLYWITRLWFRAHRRQIVDDPIVAALRDPASYAVGAAITLTMLAAL